MAALQHSEQPAAAYSTLNRVLFGYPNAERLLTIRLNMNEFYQLFILSFHQKFTNVLQQLIRRIGIRE